MIYLQILTGIAAGIVLLYLGIVILALVTMCAIRAVQRIAELFNRRAA